MFFIEDIEGYEDMTEEEIERIMDEHYRPKACNTQKSLAPLFVYFILKDYSSFDKPLKQKDIMKILEKYPYEVILERKAVSRIINSLCDAFIGVEKCQDGVYISSYR